jgi:hypothetical protein
VEYAHSGLAGAGGSLEVSGPNRTDRGRAASPA